MLFKNFTMMLFGASLICLLPQTILFAASAKKSNGGQALSGGCRLEYTSNNCTGGSTWKKDICTSSSTLKETYVVTEATNGGIIFKGSDQCGTRPAYIQDVNCSTLCTALNYTNGGSCEVYSGSCYGVSMTDLAYCLCDEDPMDNGNEISSILVDAPMDGYEGSCYAVNIYTMNGETPENTGGDLHIHLYSATNNGVGSTSGFYSNSNCSTPITCTEVPEGYPSVTVYFKAADDGTYALQAVANGMLAGGYDIQINEEEMVTKKKKNKK